MISFATKSFEDREFNTLTPVKCLVREGKTLVDKFINATKKDGNLERELSRLYAIIEDVANRVQPMPPPSKFKIYKGLKAGTFQGYEARTTNLRLYVFFDKDLIIILGGKKVDQDEDEERIKQILKDYNNSK